jgi:hypothetical protein
MVPAFIMERQVIVAFSLRLSVSPIAFPVAVGFSHALNISIRRVAVRAIPPDGSFEFVFEGNVGIVAHGAGSAMAVAEVHVSKPGYRMALVSPMTTEAESFGCIDQDVFGSP